MRLFLTKFPHVSAYIALVSATIRHSFAGKACLLIGITAALYGLLINNLNLWTDEIYSVLMAKDTLGEMFHLLLTEDSKPPLYYLYLKGILALFPKEYEIWGAHFASYILLLAAQLFAVTEVRKDYGDKTSLWLAALMLLMPQSLWLAFEVRTYMLAAFLMLAALVYGLRVSEQPEPRDYAKFGAATVLALYSHYYCALWLMFLYLFLLADILRARRFEQLKPFLTTAGAAALLFAPWLVVPLATGGEISRNWYVTMDFVRVSAQFFTTPPAAEIWQSPFFIATTLAATSLTFIVICGLMNITGGKMAETDGYGRLFSAAAGTVLATYLLLILLSVTVRPMVTARYMYIFSLIWYAAGAAVLAKSSFLPRGFIIIALLGFAGTYGDFKAAFFDRGFYNLAHDIKAFVPKDKPILAFDNNNLFCEYYLPEHTCLAIVGADGEILRRPSVMTNIALYNREPDEVTFTLSSYGQMRNNKDCLNYKSAYRISHGTDLCKLDAVHVRQLLKESLDLRLNKYERH